MTRHEVEVERQVEEVKTVTEQEEFYLCDACTAEVDVDDVFVFYNRHSEIESVDLCEDCVANPAESLRSAEIETRATEADLADDAIITRGQLALICLVWGIIIGWGWSFIL